MVYRVRVRYYVHVHVVDSWYTGLGLGITMYMYVQVVDSGYTGLGLGTMYM